MAGGLLRRSRRDENGRIVRDKTGKAMKLPHWYVWWVDASGRKRQKAAYRDKAASLKLLRDLEVEAARGETGLSDPFVKARKTPLSEHLVDFLEHLKARGVTPKQTRLVVNRLKKAFAGMRAALPKDMTADQAEKFLLSLVEDEGRSAKTRNDYLAALFQFGRWGITRGRWAGNPFEGIATLNAEADLTRERRPLSKTELIRLIDAAETRSADSFRKRCPRARPATLAKKRSVTSHLRWRIEAISQQASGGVRSGRVIAFPRASWGTARGRHHCLTTNGPSLWLPPTRWRPPGAACRQVAGLVVGE